MFGRWIKCNKIILVVILCAAVFVGIQVYMFKSVKNVEEDFYAITHNQKRSDTDYGMLLHYDYTDECEIESVKEYNFDMYYVWHNGKKGYIEVTYRYLISGKGEENYRGSSGVSRWYIEKRDKRWVVVKIEEPDGAATMVWTPEGTDVIDETFY